jgi:biopolymer transport protein ExbD
VTVTVNPDGEMLVNDVPTSEAQLYGALEAALADTREKLVILRGDKRVLLGQAVNILDLAQQAGATGIALATKPPAPKES